MAMQRKEALEKMNRFMEENPSSGVLTAGTIHDDIPTINSISTREGATLRCTREVVHIGYGCFRGGVPSGQFTFDGGGAMYKVRTEADKYDFSYTYLTPGTRCQDHTKVLLELGYDRAAVLAALKSLLAELD